MLSLTRVSSKFQITLPVSMIGGLGITKGSRVWLELNDDEIKIKPVDGDIVDILGGSLNKYVENRKLLGFSDEEIMKKTKKIVVKRLLSEGRVK